MAEQRVPLKALAAAASVVQVQVVMPLQTLAQVVVVVLLQEAMAQVVAWLSATPAHKLELAAP